MHTLELQQLLWFWFFLLFPKQLITCEKEQTTPSNFYTEKE